MWKVIKWKFIKHDGLKAVVLSRIKCYFLELEISFEMSTILRSHAIFRFRICCFSVFLSTTIMIKTWRDTAVCLLASRQQYLFDICLLL